MCNTPPDEQHGAHTAGCIYCATQLSPFTFDDLPLTEPGWVALC